MPAVPVPDPHAFPSSGMTSNSGAVANHMHDVLEGDFEPSSVAPGMTPVVQESSLEPSFASSPRLPLGDSEPGVPSTSRPVPSSMPTIPMPPVVSVQPGTPMSPVSPVTASPQMVSNEGGDHFQVAQAPKPGMPKATIAAVIAVIAVVLGGVGAGVVLSGENQDVRNQAYVAPATQKVANQASNTNTPELTGSTMSFVMTPKNAFLVAKDAYPDAVAQPLSGDGISGTIYSADSAEGKKVIFAEMTGVKPATSTSTPTAWVMHDDGTYYAFATIENAGDDGKSFLSYENSVDSKVTGFVISYENPELQIEGSVAKMPTQKAIDVRL